MDDCSNFSSAFWRLVFDAHDGLARCDGYNAVLAFATLAALSFGAFVVIDVMVLMVRRYGFAANGAGELGVDGEGALKSILGKALAVLLFGAIAAWIVAFVAAIVEFVQTAPQTAVATGVLWQVTYAQLLSRFGGKDKDQAPKSEADPAKVPEVEADDDADFVVQRATEEVAQ